ncbi:MULTISPECIES: hypothetical protein [Vibrio]|uniref:hypothetical protein n=1 Tax=Vibrio TaxID=662 RepID=UPI0002DCBC88|nr:MULTISPECIES: hypothetical protein [Vibrio]MCM5507964.1 hypothetical protein [Vibrio sp. SCSIO 43169]MDE3897514.1 hypothetical protein [Vibrio sp. CC007]QFT39173.1 hypothetical protein FIU99_22610 [Vibrio sp. THAF64]QGM36289.1 hypothetical protein GGC04_18620 [Vibrio sp. THAF191d]QGN71630.1 hypothetical protein GGC03_17820 [Vibrio sp. THAF191c]
MRNEARLNKLIQAVDGQKVHQIRCGEHRFIDITIVQTEGRFFIRQYKFSKRSWYDAFINAPSTDCRPNGAMKIGDLEVLVNGKVPDDLKMVTPRVNKAYRKLLGLIYPIMRLTFDKEKHEATTLELVPVFEN